MWAVWSWPAGTGWLLCRDAAAGPIMSVSTPFQLQTGAVNVCSCMWMLGTVHTAVFVCVVILLVKCSIRSVECVTIM